MTPEPTTLQIVTVLLFLGVLGGLNWLIRRNRHLLRPQLAAGRRLLVEESCPLGGTDRAAILSVDRARFLVVLTRGVQPVVVALPQGDVTQPNDEAQHAH
jgi:flagellar biogenesis protein FliO